MSSGKVILALVTDAYGGRGGIAQYNRDFLSALAGSEEGPKISILPRYAVEDAATPLGIQQFEPKSGRVAYSLAALRQALVQQVDIVFCGHLYMAPLAMLIARLKRATLVIQTHGIEAWTCPTALQRIAVEAADVVLCVSRYTRASVLSWGAIPPERVIVLPNTVSAAFKPGDGSPLRTAWELQGKQVLLTVGRMSSAERYKGHDRVIQALPQLVAGGGDIVYIILGEGDDQARLAALATAEGVSDRVRFMGPASPETLVDAYRMADLFVMPSAGEGFGIVFLESMACGTPVLGLSAGGARDALADGLLGTAVSESEFVGGLEKALREPRQDSAALSKAVDRRFGLDQFRAGAQSVFKRMMEAA